MRNFTGEKITVFGDWHGNLAFAASVLARVYEEENPALYIHTGDFGFWPADHEETNNPDYLSGLERLLAAQGKTLIFIDGNHEDHRWLSTFPVNQDGLRLISEHILHLPRGHAFMFNDKKIIGLGGAFSIDRGLRTKDYSWFEEELITPTDVARAISEKWADLLISHEAPMLERSISLGNPVADNVGAEQRGYVAEVGVNLGVKTIVHGHHHRGYVDSYRGIEVIGLGCDSIPVDELSLDMNYITFDREML